MDQFSSFKSIDELEGYQVSFLFGMDDLESSVERLLKEHKISTEADTDFWKRNLLVNALYTFRYLKEKSEYVPIKTLVQKDKSGFFDEEGIKNGLRLSGKRYVRKFIKRGKDTRLLTLCRFNSHLQLQLLNRCQGNGNKMVADIVSSYYSFLDEETSPYQPLIVKTEQIELNPAKINEKMSRQMEKLYTELRDVYTTWKAEPEASLCDKIIYYYALESIFQVDLICSTLNQIRHHVTLKQLIEQDSRHVEWYKVRRVGDHFYNENNYEIKTLNQLVTKRNWTTDSMNLAYPPEDGGEHNRFSYEKPDDFKEDVYNTTLDELSMMVIFSELPILYSLTHFFNYRIDEILPDLKDITLSKDDKGERDRLKEAISQMNRDFIYKIYDLCHRDIAEAEEKVEEYIKKLEWGLVKSDTTVDSELNSPCFFDDRIVIDKNYGLPFNLSYERELQELADGRTRLFEKDFGLPQGLVYDLLFKENYKLAKEEYQLSESNGLCALFGEKLFLQEDDMGFWEKAVDYSCKRMLFYILETLYFPEVLLK